MDIGCEDDRERSEMPAVCRVWAGDCLATLHVGRGAREEEDMALGVCVGGGVKTDKMILK